MNTHTEGSIIKELRRYFQNGYTYRVDNAFIFSCDWESDFFCMNREGWTFEFEVKISRSDFKADLKKNKHEIFKTGFVTQTHEHNGEIIFKQVGKQFIPNRFYYAVPVGLIAKEEVPEYAGLITVGNFANIIKRAPFIHRRKLEVRKILCDKFYHRWLEERRKGAMLEYDHKKLKENVEKMRAKYPEHYSTIYNF